MDNEDSNEWEETEYETLDWGDSADEQGNNIVSLYPSTNKPNIAALLLIIAGFVLLGTATTMNSLAEALGMSLPGSTAIPATRGRRS